MAKDNTFTIEFSKYYQGFSPAWFENSLSEFGNSGMANAMTNVNVLDPTYITQGSALINLTNGTQAGVVDEIINHILDQAITANVTYGIGATKLFKISAGTVSSGGTPSWPRTITNATDGESVALLKGKLYYFFNKSSGGDIGQYDLSSTFDDDWGSTTPTGAAALQKAPHPVAVKEDLMVFGNGRYVGYYDDSATTIDLTKLDFGNNSEVADIVFQNNKWYIAVNSPNLTGNNRSQSQVYIWDGSATLTTLDNEIGVGAQRIGFLKVINGVIYVAYQDLTASNFKIGYIYNTQIKEIATFTGALPTFAQKTLYKNTILFVSSGSIWSVGAISQVLPIQISQIADGGYATVGALSAPFGTPMVASSDGSSNQRLAKFSGFDTACNWTSLVHILAKDKMIGYIDELIVLTKHLVTSARCDITLQYNQNQSNSGALNFLTVGKRRHTQKIGERCEDFRMYLDWQNGNATNDAAIRKVFAIGHFVEEGGS